MSYFKFIANVFVFFSSTVFIYPQDNQKKIENLLQNSDNYILKDDLKSLKYAKDATKLAKESNDEQLLAKSYLVLARSLNHIGAFNKSLEYLDKGLELRHVQNDIFYKSAFKEFKGDNYNNLGLYRQELKEYSEILEILPVTDERRNQQFFSRINARIAHNYYNQKDFRNASKHIDIALKIQENLSKTERPSELYNVFLVKGEICLSSDKVDSAFYFFKKASDLIQKGIEYEFMSLKSFGDYYREVGEYATAIHYYQAALKDMENFKVSDLQYKSDITKSLADLYRMLGNEDYFFKYIQLYIEADNEHRKREKENLQTAIEIILKDDNNENKNAITGLWVVLVFISLLLFLLFIIYRKTKIKKQKLLMEKDRIELKNEENIKVLEQKLQVSIDELLEDAKKNRSSFLEKFQQVYPEFYEKLLGHYPNLNSGELELLAYIYLNFSSKDIATYTFRSYRTIQSRKYSLRKKLGLDSHEDFYIWLRNLS